MVASPVPEAGSYVTAFTFCTGPEYSGTCSTHLSTDADFSACHSVPAGTFTLESHEGAIVGNWYNTTDCTGKADESPNIKATSQPELRVAPYYQSWNVVWAEN